MSRLTLDDVLNAIRRELDLSRETERELIDEIRGHLEDSIDDARLKGVDDETALLKAAEKFGVTEVGKALQSVHAPWESAEAILTCFVPVLTALILRWIVYSPDGTLLGWQTWLRRPAFWIVAFVMLLIPLLQFKQWRYTIVSWSLFWAITMIFMVLPTIQSW